MKIFKNWPNVKTRLDFINKLKISENYAILGNQNGKISIYKLN